MGEIITFYSYKGGVGRSMALANVGTLLAKWGFKVLMIDWDLEAPGLEFYFREYARPSRLAARQGILELLNNAYADQNQQLEWKRCVRRVGLPGTEDRLTLITAGRTDGSYFQRLRHLDMDMLYKLHGGYRIESLRNEWKDSFDFVLVDSRTGITDMGGVCTVQLPDYLVALFVANRQNVEGIREVAKGIQRARQRLPFDRTSLTIVPIVSRFDSSEEFRISKQWINQISELMDPLYADWLPSSTSRPSFVEATKLPYIPFFSFGEKLPALEQGTADPSGLGFAYESLAALLANRLERADELLFDRSGYIRSASNFRNVPHSLDSSGSVGNPELRMPVVLLLDTSGSMAGAPIEQLNRSLQRFARQIRSDPLVGCAVDIAIVTFGGYDAEIVQPFVNGSDFAPPRLVARGGTVSGAGIDRALDLLRERTDQYRAGRVPYYRPWLLLMTDGSPSDSWNIAARRLRAEEAERRIHVFPVAIGDSADLAFLNHLSLNRPAVRLDNLKFDELFHWISSSVAALSSTAEPSDMRLPPLGWAKLQ